jgi:glycosyltransferase involved in cell wall biosynthesis
MNPSVISVIIPTFNRSQLLQQTLDSLQKQTFKDWEALVVDDGSEDDTEEKVLRMGKADPRIRYIKRTITPSGPSVCRNEGTNASKGKYIIYLDSDDCLRTRGIGK